MQVFPFKVQEEVIFQWVMARIVTVLPKHIQIKFIGLDYGLNFFWLNHFRVIISYVPVMQLRGSRKDP